MIDLASAAADSGAGLSSSATLFAAMRENQLWLAAMDNDGTANDPQFASNVLPRIGIEGGGYLVLDDGGHHVFVRQTDVRVGPGDRLVDNSGSPILGYPAAGKDAHASRDPEPLRLPRDKAGKPAAVEIDESGRVLTRPAAGDPPTAQGVEIGRIALAVFASPKDMQSAGNRFVATSTSGAPTYFPADAPHLGKIRHNPPRLGSDGVRANLRALWTLSGRAEMDIALAASADALARTALNLVR